ncbi:unnamed protein product [Durusdinium trenchii]|uniref:Uncharacterized protein n=1 Tax=Durusdinium trenchii TaxID=1381693 RepID=A0ABP0M4H0_9DINO
MLSDHGHLRNLLIPPDSFHDFCTPDKLTGTRYWPKMLCDEDGLNCLLGSSGGPGEGCTNGQYDQCAPPIDTKFEEHATTMQPLTEKQMWHTIKQLSNKAPGLDGIGFDFLKALPYAAMRDLVQMYHKIEAEAMKKTVISALLDAANFYDRINLQKLAERWLVSNYPGTHAAFAMRRQDPGGQKGHRAAQWSLVGRGRGHLKEKNLRKPKCGAANEDEGPPKMRYSSWLYRSSSPPSPSTTKRAEERELGVALKAARWAFRTGMLNFVKRLGGKSATLLAECALPYALCIVNVYVNKYITAGYTSDPRGLRQVLGEFRQHLSFVGYNLGKNNEDLQH